LIILYKLNYRNKATTTTNESIYSTKSEIILQSKREKSRQSDKDWTEVSRFKPKKKKDLNEVTKKNKSKEIQVEETWTKDDVMLFKPKKINMRDENIAHNLNGRVFDTKTFVDKDGTCRNLSTFLKWITWDQVPQLIGSMLRYSPKSTTPKQAAEHTEHIRRVKSISQIWHTQEGIKPLQMLLIDTYAIDPKIISIGVTSFKQNPRIFINLIEQNTDLIDMETQGFLTFLKEAPKHLFWGEGKIRSTTKNLLSSNKTEEEIIDFFKKKFNLPPSLRKDKIQNIIDDQKLTRKSKQKKDRELLKKTVWNKEEDLKCISWCIPYLPPEYFMYDSVDKAYLCIILKSKLEGLRNKILQFIRMLCKYQTMTIKEKKEIKKDRIMQFTDRMRSPEIQSLFLTGVKKDVICDQIYKELALKFEEQVLTSAIFCVKEQKKRKEKDRNIKSSRQTKQHRNNQWQHDDEYGQIVLESRLWSETYSNSLQIYFDACLDYTHAIFVGILVTCFVPIINFFSLKFGIERIQNSARQQIDEARQNWTDCIKSPFVWAAKPENKIRMVQINSIFQIINLTFHKKYQYITGHAINLGITSWDNMGDFITLLQTRFEPTIRGTYTINGIQRQGTSADFQTDFSAIRAGLPLPERDDVELQSKFLNQVDDYLKNLSLPDWSSKTISEMNQKFIFVKNAASITKSSMDLFKSIVSIICRTLFGVDPFCPDFMEYMFNIEHVLDQIHRYDLMTPEQKAHREKAAEIWKIYNEIELIRRDSLFQTLPNYKVNFFLAQCKKFDEIYQTSKHLNGMMTDRKEPTCVALLGRTGTGKTASTNFIKESIVYLDYIEGKSDISKLLPEHSYACNFNDDFWSGYVNQKFATVDDIFADADTQVRARQAKEIINMVNTAAYPLNMAGLSEKGCTFFNSDYVFLTTNLTTKSLSKSVLQLGLTDTTAFTRRLHLVLIRNDPISSSFPLHQTFQVDQCIQMPEFEGKELSLKEVVLLIRQLREKSVEQLNRKTHTETQLHEFFFDREIVDFEQRLSNLTPSTFHPESFSNRDDQQMSIFTCLTKDINRGILEWYNNLEWRNILLFFFVAAVSSTTLLIFYKYLTSGKNEEDDLFTPHSISNNQKSGRMKKKPIKTTKINIRNLRKDVNLENGDEFPISNYDMAFPKLMSGTAIIGAEWIEDGKKMYNSAQCSHMENGWFMTPTHFFLNNGDDCRYVIKFDNHKYLLDDLDEIKEAEGLDISLFKLPSHCQLPKALFKYLSPNSTSSPLVPGVPIRLVRTHKSGDHEFQTVNKVGGIEKIVYGQSGQFFEFYSELTYNSRTSAGDSGSILVIEGNQNRPQIVGMHVGVRSRVGCSIGLGTPITQEVIALIMNKDLNVKDEEEDVFEEQCAIQTFPHEILRTIPLLESFNRPRFHKIRPSVAYGWNGPPTQYPVRLIPFVNKDGLTIDPYIVGVSKLHQEYTPEILEDDGSVDWLISLYPPQEDRRLLNFSEVIKGTGEFFSSVNAGTSPGYPYCLMKEQTKGKSPWITVDKISCEIEWTEDLESLVQTYEASLLKGENIEVLWADVLKTERRPIEKVNAGKTRLFSTCPLHYLCLMRKYFGKITEYIQSQSTLKPVSVGINAHSLDWTILYNRLSKTNGSVIAGDFENYDGRIPRFIGEKRVLAFVNRWYDDGPVNARVRALLFEHIYNATRLTGNVIYQVKDGNPSGNPWTSFYNSLGQLCMWYPILTQVFCLSPDTWNIVVYGDDNVLTTDKVGLRVNDFQPYFKQFYGMNYTHFSKKEGVTVHDTLESIRYLGRAFTPQRGFYKAAPLELSVIVESTYWTNGPKVDFEVLMSTVESFVNEIFHFGVDFYRRFCGEFLTWLKENIEDQTLLHGLESRLLLPYNTIYFRNYGGGQTAEQYKNYA